MTAATYTSPLRPFRSLVMICLAIATSIAIFALMPLLIRRTLQQATTNLPRPTIAVAVVIQPPLESGVHPGQSKRLPAPSSQPPPVETKAAEQKSQAPKPQPPPAKNLKSSLKASTRFKQKRKAKAPRQPASKLPAKESPPKPLKVETGQAQAPQPPATATPVSASAAANRPQIASIPLPAKTSFEAHEVDRQPLPVSCPQPKYPYRLRRRGIEGVVNVRFLVNRDGHPRHVSILNANPKGFFENSVLQIVPKWRFKPGLNSGRAVDVWVEETIRFSLES